MSNYQKPFPRRAGTITAIVQGIATVTLDTPGGSRTVHLPSMWRGRTGAANDAEPKVGDRVEVLGEAMWRE
jgi:hypothetical protein